MYDRWHEAADQQKQTANSQRVYDCLLYGAVVREKLQYTKYRVQNIEGALRGILFWRGEKRQNGDDMGMGKRCC